MSTEIDRETVKKLAKLCKIDCTEEEIKSLEKDLEKIVEHFMALDTLDTQGVPPCSHVLEEMEAHLREDVVEGILSRDAFLSNAPQHTGGLVRVPPVLSKNN